MILLEVRNYIKQKKWVNLQDLSFYFKRDPETMRDILGHWLRKGVIHRAQQPTGCGIACGQCRPSVAEVYCYHSVRESQPPVKVDMLQLNNNNQHEYDHD